MKTPLSLTLLTLGTIFSPVLSAASVGWTRTDSENTSTNVSFTAPSSGTVNSESSAWYGFHQSGTGPETPTSPTGFSMVSGDQVQVKYDFDHFFTDGTGELRSALQYGDYTISIFGGNGTIDASQVTFGTGGNESSGVQGVDFDFSGDGTQSLFLDNLGSSAAGFYGSFEINGTWKGLTIKQTHNADGPASRLFDAHAQVRFTGIVDAVPVPEPSSSALALLAGLTLLRRKR